jgi:hypothetical protein
VLVNAISAWRISSGVAPLARPAGHDCGQRLGMDGRRRAKLDQLDHFFLQRPRLTHGRAQCLHGVQVLRVLLFEVSVGVVLFLLCHLFFLANPCRPAPMGPFPAVFNTIHKGFDQRNLRKATVG